MTHDLAIVVPAYKPDFFELTLQSIQEQTDQRFTLYIFNDAGPGEIETIVNRYQNDFDDRLHYKYFEKNMGRESIIGQWKRCIDHTGNEKWIWLFADDDLMAQDCVKSFYKSLEENPGYAAYRFDTQKILADGEVVRENRFPDTFNGAEFLNLKLSYEQESYIVEYIFSRDTYNEIGGIPDLPLAWAADDFFCLKLANTGGICSIKGGRVDWRYSDANISGSDSRKNANLKLEAALQFVSWILDHRALKQKLQSEDLPVSWYLRQIRSMNGQLTLVDELKAVVRMARIDKGIISRYLKMKKDQSRLTGWLKRFSS